MCPLHEPVHVHEPVPVHVPDVCTQLQMEKAAGVFWRTAEKDYNEFALFYGLPSLSVKVCTKSQHATAHLCQPCHSGNSSTLRH